jgi:hypothetical protein
MRVRRGTIDRKRYWWRGPEAMQIVKRCGCGCGCCGCGCVGCSFLSVRIILLCVLICCFVVAVAVPRRFS